MSRVSMHVVSVCGGICSTRISLFAGLERRMVLSSEIAESVQEKDSSWHKRWCVLRVHCSGGPG